MLVSELGYVYSKPCTSGELMVVSVHMFTILIYINVPVTLNIITIKTDNIIKINSGRVSIDGNVPGIINILLIWLNNNIPIIMCQEQ